MTIVLIGLGVFLFLRRRSRRNLDYIEHVRSSASSKDEEILTTPAPFLIVDPSGWSTAGVHDQMTLSLSRESLNAVQVQSGLVHEGSTQSLTHHYTASQSK